MADKTKLENLDGNSLSLIPDLSINKYNNSNFPGSTTNENILSPNMRKLPLDNNDQESSRNFLGRKRSHDDTSNVIENGKQKIGNIGSSERVSYNESFENSIQSCLDSSELSPVFIIKLINENENCEKYFSRIVNIIYLEIVY